MKRTDARRAVVAAFLALTAGFWVVPTGAFDAAQLEPRDVTADVVGHGSAYLALSWGACQPSPAAGGSCTATLTNRAGDTQTLSARLDTNPNNVVSTYNLTGAAPVSPGVKVSTPSPISVGGSTTLTLNLRICLSCSGNTYTTIWTVEGTKAGVMEANITRVAIDVTYGVV